ncbi:hypothetical protein Tco_0579630 [Tanacetum coccineum]
MGKVCAFIRFNLTFDFSFHTSELKAATNGVRFIASNSRLSFRAIRKLTHHGMLFLPIGRTIGGGMFGIDEAKGASSYGARIGDDDNFFICVVLRTQARILVGQLHDCVIAATVVVWYRHCKAYSEPHSLVLHTFSLHTSMKRDKPYDFTIAGGQTTNCICQSSSVAHKQSVTTHHLNTDPDAQQQGFLRATGTSSPCDPFSLLTKV